MKFDWDSDGAIVMIFFCIVGLIIFLLSGCSIQVTESEPTEYCFADYKCSWYDYNGALQTSWLCYEEIQPNMTCK